MPENNIQEVSLKESIHNIIDLIKSMIRHWYIIIGISILGCLLGYFYAKTKKVLYTAYSTFVIESGNSEAGNANGVAAMLGMNIGSGQGGMFQGESLFELYKSNKVIQEALFTPLVTDSSQLLIQKLLQINEDLSLAVAKNSRVDSLIQNASFFLKPEDQFERTRDSLVIKVSNLLRDEYLIVEKPNKKANIIRVEVNAEDEEFSKLFNERIVLHVNNLYLELKSGKSRENVLILQHKVDSVKAVMMGAISRASIISDETPNLNPTRQSERNIPLQQSMATTETNKVILNELLRNLEMSKIGLSKETPLIQVLDPVIYPLKKTVPNKMKFMIIGGIISGILGSFLYALVYFFKKIMRS